MPSDKSAFSDMMEPLRRKYLAHVSEKRPELTEFLKHCEQEKATDSQREIARHIAHKLCGSGTTYGFPDITAAGRALEDALDNRQPEMALIPLTKNLLEACNQALRVTGDMPAPPAASAAQKTSAATKPLLLAVDDDPAILNIITELFAADAKIITAANGKQALEMIRREQPDLVILDDIMPEMTGMKLLETLQQSPSAHPPQIIMLTASNRPADIMRGVMTGASEYITKPFNPAEFAQKIRARLARLATTIVIADDDDAIRELLGHKFRQTGVRVLLAENGTEALKLIQKTLPQLILLDRMMPGMDGVEVLQKLREDAATRDIPVLFLTAKHQERDILEGFRLGAADYIVKPFIPEEVVARCFRLLAKTGDAS